MYSKIEYKLDKPIITTNNYIKRMTTPTFMNIPTIIDIESLSISTITISKEQTKIWRKAQSWYINGKKNECDIYQRKIILIYI